MDVNERIKTLMQERGWTPYRLAKESAFPPPRSGAAMIQSQDDRQIAYSFTPFFFSQKTGRPETAVLFCFLGQRSPFFCAPDGFGLYREAALCQRPA